jgi:hypothetical protein
MRKRAIETPFLGDQPGFPSLVADLISAEHSRFFDRVMVALASAIRYN